MSCCKDRPIPDTNIPFDHLGSDCDNWSHLKDMFDYLQEERACAVPCDPERFSVQFIAVDAMTYSYIVTDKLIGRTIEYTVTKSHTHESPTEAFNGDWRLREAKYNRMVVNALYDQLEALDEASNGLASYKLERNCHGYKISRFTNGENGLVIFDYKLNVSEGLILEPDDYINVITSLPFTGEVGYTVTKLLKRLKKIGFNFYHVTRDTDLFGNKIIVHAEKYHNLGTVINLDLTFRETLIAQEEILELNEYYRKGVPDCGCN